VSILFAAVGIPLYALGFVSLFMQISNDGFAAAFGIVSLVGLLGGMFIHTMCCLTPIIYKSMKDHVSFDVMENILNTVYNAVKIPFMAFYVCIVFIPSFMIGYAIIMDYLLISAWFILLTPLPLMIVGIVLRIIKKEWFSDLPGIIMPSVGLGMVGLMAALNTLA
jgi:hypothetical protein